MSNTAGSAKPLKAVIIGCGAIAGGYDEGNAGPDIRSHAKAYREHPGFTLVGCVEPDGARRRTFMNAWDIPSGAADLGGLIDNGIDFEIASVCSPTADHATELEKLLGFSVQGVFCEKPLSDELKTAQRLVSAYESKGIPLAVNYLRRWDNAIGALKDAIGSGAWGKLQTAVCHYGKGICHNGSHMIDILQYLFGPLSPENVMRKQTDFSETDPTLDAMLKTETGSPIYMLGTDSRLFDIFEACLTFEKGEVVLEQGLGVIRQRHIEDSPRFKGHKSLDAGGAETGALGRALYCGLDNLYNAVTENAPLISSGKTALAAQSVCSQLTAMASDL